MKHERFLENKMKRDAIDFEKDKVSTLFRKLLVPTLLGTISISAVTAIDGIFVGHGVGADGVAAVNIVVPIYQIMSGIGLMIGAGCSVGTTHHQLQLRHFPMEGGWGSSQVASFHFHSYWYDCGSTLCLYPR